MTRNELGTPGGGLAVRFPRRGPGLHVTRSRSRAVWFSALLAAVCFEGLGRRFLPEVPGAVLYLTKDVVLLTGFALFGRTVAGWRDARRLFRGFGPFLVLAFFWTVLELFNPGQRALEYGALGLRSYWLWWIAPPAVASALRSAEDRRLGLTALALFGLGIAALAAVQFALPGDNVLNAYVVDPTAPVAVVPSTGRVRVTATFSYITGFTDFVVVALPLLLSIGLASPRGSLRWLALAAAVAISLATPMSGSRGAVVLGAVTAAIVVLAAGTLKTAAGRRAVAGVALSAVLIQLAGGEAMEGVVDRFRDDPGETRDRIEGTLSLIPPVAALMVDNPLLGIGTGMEQNAAAMAAIQGSGTVEGEPDRILFELGTPGYLLLSAVRIGLGVALLRAARELLARGRRAEAGAALSLVPLAFVGMLFFDHVFQALFFVGCGIVLGAVVEPDHGTRARASGRT